MGAGQALVVRITHIGTTARVRLTAYTAPSGQVAYWDSLLVIGGPEELDVAFQRLAHAMQLGKPVRDSAELDTVTDKEMQTLNNRKANKSFGVHMMTFLPFNTAEGSFGPVRAAAYSGCTTRARGWRTCRSIRRPDEPLVLGGHRRLLPVPARGLHAVRRRRRALGVHGLRRQRAASGICFQPTFGILLGRLSSVQLRADLGYFINSFGEYGTGTTIANGQQVASVDHEQALLPRARGERRHWVLASSPRRATFALSPRSGERGRVRGPRGGAAPLTRRPAVADLSPLAGRGAEL